MKETFVTQTENNNIVKNVFIIIGYSIVSIIMVMALLWGYFTSHYLCMLL